MEQTTKPLTIYKASAGSGKTFKLALEYIKLLIRDPNNYRYTLAVTFTNKATQEMKTRILSKLYGIAHSYPDAEPYMDYLRAAFPRERFPDDRIRSNASEALERIVHNYHYFRIETIDSFFQSILRNLARELGLTANLQVSLNDNEVESEAVDNVIENISSNSDPLLGWIMDFVRQRMDDSKSWNVIAQIKTFGQNIFKDFYKEHQKVLQKVMSSPTFFREYNGKLRARKAQSLQLMAQYATRFSELVQRFALTDKDFCQGHRAVPGYFEKLGNGDFLGMSKTAIPNKYVQDALSDSRCILKSPDRPEATDAIAALLAQAEGDRKKATTTVCSVDLTLKNINELRLLGRIGQEVEAINTANNNYPLSNTQKLLKDLIEDHDSPFIYEKIGGRIQYIMIDEFQDTSTVQWENFKVLLDDCIAHQAGSLIVGDVKQSIYRWRNGDWRLLQGFKDGADPRVHVDDDTLNTNYRSQRNIIAFNNAFFSLAAHITCEEATADLKAHHASSKVLAEAREIVVAYDKVAQKIRPGREQAGAVSITLLPSDGYEERVTLQVRRQLEYLLEADVAPSDIAILVRYRKDISTLAAYFQQQPVTVHGKEVMLRMVSDEAFRLDASLAIRVLVKAMHVLAHPEDHLAIAMLVKAWNKVGHPSATVDDTALFVGRGDIATLLPDEMRAGGEKLRNLPIMELAERLFQIFGLSRLTSQSAYIFAFFDLLADWTQNHIGGIGDFLADWDDTLSATSIHSDAVDGIRLLTIHKSKGLEFDNVIIPYCDWAVEKTGETLWVSPTLSPYNELPIVPVNLYAKQLQASIYREAYQSEHLQNLMDNLNLLYVAFTRASRNLFVIGRSDTMGYPSELISKALDYQAHDAPDQMAPGGLIGLLPGALLTEEADGEAAKQEGTSPHRKEKKRVTRNFQFGKLSIAPKKHADETSANIFEQREVGIGVPFSSFPQKATFRQSNDSAAFIQSESEAEARRTQQEYIKTGNVIHSLLASIHDVNDIDRAIDQLEFDGILYNHPMTRESLKGTIHRLLLAPQVNDWFSPHWTVHNERSILYEADGEVKESRPDRVITDGRRVVVIDFKTGKASDRHREQVRHYMDLLRSMGYNHVSGFLWYVRQQKVVEV